MESIVVSVICNAYNHEKYIRQALDSFVMQKTDFAVEVLIHDDASTDKTAQIIREYEEKYPELIKPIYQQENQYSQKIPVTLTYQFPRVKGEFVAFCEGDDYWTDPYKLQKQVDALRAHPEVDICTHAVSRKRADTGELIDVLGPQCENGAVVPTEEVILGGGGFVGTNSIMYRTKINADMPQFRKQMHIDYTTQIHGALRGGMLYLTDNMADYRFQAEGSWSVRVGQAKKRYANFLERLIGMLQQLDVDTNGAYHQEVEHVILENKFELLEAKGDYRALHRKPYRQLYKKLSFRRRMGILVKGYAPWIYRIIRK